MMTMTTTIDKAICESNLSNDMCLVCKHWRVDAMYDGTSGKCHQGPPTVLSAQECVWPPLRFDSACGQFSLDEARRASYKKQVFEQSTREQVAKDARKTALEVLHESNSPPTQVPVIHTAPPVLSIDQVKAFQANRLMRQSSVK